MRRMVYSAAWLLILVTTSPLHAQLRDEIIIPNGDFSERTSSWKTQATGQGDATFETANGALEISRKESDYYLRAYQDVEVVFDRAYEMTFRLKVRGSGSGQGWVIAHSSIGGGKWLTAHDEVIRSKLIKDTDEQWQTVTVRVPAIEGIDRLRLNFAPIGANTTVWIDDVRLYAVAKEATSQTLRVPQLDMRPTLDGKLDETFWRFALKLDDFRILGKPEIAAEVATQVRLAIYQNALWIGYELDEPNPLGLRALVNRQDDIAVHSDDSAQVFLSLDRKNIVQLIVNVLGRSAVGGKELSQPLQRTWYEHQKLEDNVQYRGTASRTSNGWSVEMQVPLLSLVGHAPVETDAHGHPILYVNFGRHRPQNRQAPYTNWARFTGRTFFAADQLQPVALEWDRPILSNSANHTSTGDFTYRLGQPDHLIAGDPILMQWSDDRAFLPADVVWDTGDLAIAPIVKGIVAPSVVMTGGGRSWTIRCRLWDQAQQPVALGKEQMQRLSSDEAFSLKIGVSSVDVAGRTHAAVMRGLATLAMLCDGAKVQGKNWINTGVMYDAPALPIRGWMLGVSTPDHIIEQAKALFLLRYNHVQFDVVGYGAYTLFPFDSHPNIGGQTTTKEQWARVADTIRALGMVPVPTVYLWSRAGHIALKPEYKHLAVRPDLPVGTFRNAATDKNLSAAQEESYQLVFDLLDEVIDTFAARNVHLALDEVHFDELVSDPASKQLNLKPSDWLVRVINRTRDHLHARGARMWMWADNLDPNQNGRHLDISGPELLAQLPQDIVLHDWKYRAPGPYRSLKMFKDAGFTTVSASWYEASNVASIIGDTLRFGADGFIGTTWNGWTPNQELPTELVTARALGAYLSWSPQFADQLDRLPMIPALLYQTATIHHGTQPVNNIICTSIPPVATTIAGKELAQALILPPEIPFDVLRTSVPGPLGGTFLPWLQDGLPAAVMVRGGESETIEIPLRGTAKSIGILHVTSRQTFHGTMAQMVREYRDAVPAHYAIKYEDDSTAELPLFFRRQINAWDDIYPASEAWPVLYGTVADTYHLNIPAMLWNNPHPDKPLKALMIGSGNRRGMDTAIFAVSLIREGE